VDGSLGDRLKYKCHDGVGASPPYPLLAHQGRSEDALVPLQTGPVLVGYVCNISFRQLPSAPMFRTGATGTRLPRVPRFAKGRIPSARPSLAALRTQEQVLLSSYDLCAPVREVQ